MANTPYGSWAGCPHFGLRGMMEKIAGGGERVETAVREINLALDDLGISNFRAQSIKSTPAQGKGTVELSVTLASAADSSSTISLDWSAKR